MVMKIKVILTSLIFFVGCSFSFAQLINDYRSIMNTHGDWNNISIWERWNGTAWVPATVPPPDGINIAIPGNAAPVISSDITYSNLTFVPYNSGGSGTITLNAKFIIAGTVNINCNTSNGGPIFSAGTGTIIVNSGSIFNINFINAGDFFYPSITNNGIININSGTSASYGLCVNGRFSNKGTINCLSHIFSLRPTGSTNDTIAGIVTVSAGATFGLAGSNLGNTIVVTGNISGAGNVDLSSTGGNWNGNVFFTPSSTYNISGTTYLGYGQSGGTNTFSSGMTLTNLGSIIAGGGATTFQSGLSIPPNLKLRIDFGNVIFNTGCNLSSAELNYNPNSKLTANATVYIQDSLVFNPINSLLGYVAAGTDSVVVLSSGIIKGRGGVDGKLVNNGTAYIAGMSGSGTFVNNNIAYLSNIMGDVYCNFINRGTYIQNLPIGLGISNLTNYGTVSLQSGTLSCSNMDNYGMVSIFSGATLAGGINYMSSSLVNDGTINGTLNIKNNCVLSGNGIITGGNVRVFGYDTLTLGSDHQMQFLFVNNYGGFKLNGKTLSLNGTPRPLQNNSDALNFSLGSIKYNGTSTQYTGGSPYLGLPSSVKSFYSANTSTVNLEYALTVSDTLYLNSGTLSVSSILNAPNIQYLGGSISPVPSSVNTITINSASATIPASVNNLTITNPSGTTINNNVLVNSSLNLTNGALITGANSITLGSSGTVTETVSNFVKGNIITSRTVPAGVVDAPQSFGNLGIMIGDGTDNLGNVTVKRVAGVSEGIITVNGNSGIKRKWIITADNQPINGRTLTFTWPSTDDNGIIWSPALKAVVFKSTDGGTTFFQVGNPVDVSGSNPRSISINVTSFSIFTIGAENAPLPIEISSFNSIVKGNNVSLNWITAFELNNKGFVIQKCSANDTLDWKEIGFVNGKGNSNYQVSYKYNDKNLKAGKYKYRLMQEDFNGNYTIIDLKSEVNILPPLKYELSQNYPNPFNPTTKIRFDVTNGSPIMTLEDEKVVLKVYDVIGREVRTLVNEPLEPGTYEVSFNGSSLNSGVYFYKLIIGNFVDTKKMLLIK